MHLRGGMARWLAACGGLCALLGVPRPLLAAGRLGQNGEAITTSSYSIDLFQGALLAGNRVIGLGGAYVALAEDVDGDLQNPAAPAMRPFFSVEHFDYWLGLGLTSPAGFSDFFNSGSASGFRGSADRHFFVTPAINLQWGTFGLGVTLELQNYAVEGRAAPNGIAQSGSAALDTVLSTVHVQGANSFFDGQLVLGGGLRYLTLELDATAPESTSTLFDSSGSGLEVGAVWRPNLQPYRLGVAFRSAIDTEPSFSRSLLPTVEGDIVLGEGDSILYLPERASLPWDVNIGAAVQLGKRPLNPVPQTIDSVSERARLTFRLRQLERDEERERRLAQAATPDERASVLAELAREETEDSSRLSAAFEEARRALAESSARVERFYLMLSASLVISGSVRDAVGVESFLDQTVNRSGGEVVYSPRFGVESEVWEDRLKLRAGSYLEPSRFATSSARLHGTAGGTMRLFGWNVFGLWPDDFMWQVGGSIDVAPRYFSWTASIGGWYPRHPRGEPL
ncbi:MAG: hypothetical protein RL033_4333 [Pseudomonadota bacterium]|jgi:uncharacterized membrane protein